MTKKLILRNTPRPPPTMEETNSALSSPLTEIASTTTSRSSSPEITVTTKQPKAMPSKSSHIVAPSYILPRAHKSHPKPTLSIILIHGTTTSQPCQTATETFATAIGYKSIHIPTYLHQALSQPNCTRLLGSLHPLSLRQKLETNAKIDAFFMIPILEKMLDEAVTNHGLAKLMISGLDGYEIEVWRGFAEKVAKPNALFSFVGTVASAEGLMVEDVFKECLVRVAIRDRDDARALYTRLLGATYEKAMSYDTWMKEVEVQGGGAEPVSEDEEL